MEGCRHKATSLNKTPFTLFPTIVFQNILRKFYSIKISHAKGNKKKVSEVHGKHFAIETTAFRNHYSHTFCIEFKTYLTCKLQNENLYFITQIMT